MNLLRIKDNSGTPKETFDNIPNLTSKIANKNLGQLEKEGVFLFPELLKDADDITKEQMIIKSRNGEYWTENIMGFLGCGNERLIIESRFSQGEDYFFHYLLSKVLEMPNIIDFKTDANRESQLFQFLLFLFPHYLKLAMRKGLFKEYIKRKYNDANPRGTIDVPRHINENTPFVGKIAYSQREFAWDNHLTQLIRHTIEFIKSKPYGNKILAKIREEVNLVIGATGTYSLCDRNKIVAKNNKEPISHGYFREYRALQRLCLLILQHQRHNFGLGTKSIYGILFDGAWLWEEYINTLVGEAFYHPKNKTGEHAQYFFTGGNGKIYPDFIGKKEAERIIGDAKYRPVENINRGDYFQLLAYMFRFDSKLGYYFYPEARGGDDKCLMLNQGSTFEGNVKPRDDVKVIKHGLKIPQYATSYEEFVDEMEEREREFVEELT